MERQIRPVSPPPALVSTHISIAIPLDQPTRKSVYYFQTFRPLLLSMHRQSGTGPFSTELSLEESGQFSQRQKQKHLKVNLAYDTNFSMIAEEYNKWENEQKKCIIGLMCYL